MGLLKRLLLGRPDGLRASLRRKSGGKPADQAPRPPSSLAPREPGVVAGGSAPKEPPKDVNPPEGYEVVLHKDGLQPGELTEIIIGGTAVAMCNVDGEFFAMTNVCPHAGGPIGDGTLESHTVTCPYHGWSYDVRDGACAVNKDVTLKTYPVHVEGDAVCVKL